MRNTIFFALLALAAACNQTSSAQNLDAKEFQSLMEDTDNKVILDVRTPQEYNVNHIKDAVNLNIYDRDFEAKANELDKDKTVFVYCKSGGRSNEAVKILEKNGYEVYNLNGGLLKWQSNGLAIEQGKTKAPAPTFTLDQYNQMVDSNGLVLVDFMAEWCGPCKLMAPGIEELKKEYGDQLTVVKIDVDRNQELSRHFKVSSIPMIKIYHQGELVFDEIGYRSKEQLQTELQSYL